MSMHSSSMHSAFAAAMLDPGLPAPPGLRAWNGSSAAHRLRVYRNTVAASLVAALADTYPVVEALVGEEFFKAMAIEFVRANPPSSPLLDLHGAGFADFLAGFAPVRQLPYLADVARLEMARLEAMHTADAFPVAVAAIEAAMADVPDATQLRFTMHPSLRVVESDFAAVSIWAAHQGHCELADVDTGRAECALVVRPFMDLLVVPCDAGSSALARSLLAGRDFGQSAEAAAQSCGFDLSAALGLLLTHGAIVSIRMHQEDRA